jgi:hypothetical protein
MQKTVIVLAFMGFVLFGGLFIENVIAYSAQVEAVKIDKDPKKANDKEVADINDTTTTNVKIIDADTKITTSSNSDKSYASQECGY